MRQCLCDCARNGKRMARDDLFVTIGYTRFVYQFRIMTEDDRTAIEVEVQLEKGKVLAKIHITGLPSDVWDV